MNDVKIMECIPNFSEGRDESKIRYIADAIRRCSDVHLLHIDPNRDANRTVMTLAGSPEGILEAAYQGIKAAYEVIDMADHKGEHPRIGSTDVCPIVPMQNTSMKDAKAVANTLAHRVSEDLKLPIYFYEENASSPLRVSLANIRKGQYEGLERKMQDPRWKPDLGRGFDSRSGALVIGARKLLVAYNLSLSTKDVSIAQDIARKLRKTGYLRQHEGRKIRVAGRCKGVKAIGWYMDGYDCAQVSMNVFHLAETKLHEAYESCVALARDYGVSILASELIGMLPKQVLIDAGQYYTAGKSIVSEEELLDRAISALKMNTQHDFIKSERILENAYPKGLLCINNQEIYG